MKIENRFYKFLLDTGSSISLIRFNTLPGESKEVNPIRVRTIEGNIILSKAQEITSSQSGISLTFFVHDFCQNYDGLLGYDSLQKLKAVVNIAGKFIILNDRKYYFLDENQGKYDKKALFHLEGEEDGNGITKGETKTLFRLDHLNEEEYKEISTLLKKHKNIIYKEDENLSFTHKIKHRINTKHEDPIYVKSYRYPEVHREEVDRQIKEMLEQNIICHSKSPYSAPIWVVPKKQDASGLQKWRIVIDYRKLNNITVDDKYPIPLMDEILDKLGRCMYFTTLDLTKGFYQIEVEPRDRHKTAFSTRNGHYEFLRMPFGLKNAPATFQRLMNTVLDELIGKDCLVYLDDIVVFSTSLQEHISSLDKVFKKLSEANLKIQLDKCEFLQKQAEFLGHIITPDGIKPNPNKIKAIVDYPIPKTEKEIKQFLGLAGFYRKFIQNFSNITKPLTQGLKKGNKINYTDKDYIKAVETIKILITKEPILAYPNYEKPFVLTTDASNVALGAVLSQNSHPICFASRTLNTHETNYSATEKELLAIVWATKYFRPYLFGRKFVINSDHRPLQWLHNLKEPNAKLQRWKIKLNEFDFDIKYIPGRENHVADALSRIKTDQCYLNESQTESLRKTETIAGNDDEHNEISSIAATCHSADEDNQNYIAITEKPLNIFRNQIKLIKGNQNKTFRAKQFSNNITTIVYTNLNEKLIKDIIKTHLLNKNITIYMPNDEDFYLLQEYYSKLIQNNSHKVIRTTKLLETINNFPDLKSKILEIHITGLHQGIEKIVKIFRNKYYYPNYVKEISNIINECELCNNCKNDHISNKLAFKITPPTYEIREKFVIDFWQWNKQYYLTCIDVFSKFATLEPVNSLNWIETKKALIKIFNSMGPPKTLKIDQDQGMNNVNIKNWCQELNIKLEVTTGKTGIADIERLHKTLNEKLRIINTSKDKELIYLQIEQTLFTYNHIIIHSTTGETPYNIFFNKSAPQTNPQEIKENRINNINKTRVDKPIATNYLKSENSRKRLEKISNPFKKVEVTQIEKDNEHYIVKHKNRNVRKYKTQFKRKKKSWP